MCMKKKNSLNLKNTYKFFSTLHFEKKQNKKINFKITFSKVN